MTIICDLESDGLLDTVTKIHCLCYYDIDTKLSGSLTEYDSMRWLLTTKDLTIVGHNFQLFDKRLVKKILGIDIKARIWDSLGISWYLYPNREVHGLESWGHEFGINKPDIFNWKNGSIESYIYRCSEDVKINTKLYELQLDYLNRIYKNDILNRDRLVGYLGYKLDCAAEQEEIKWRLDIDKTKENLIKLEAAKEPKASALQNSIPNKIIFEDKIRPKIMFKKNGEVSALGQKWLDFLKIQGLPEYHNGSVKIIKATEPGNVYSHQQRKDWLFALGWIPTTFKFVKDKNTPYDKKTPPRKIPQLVKIDRSGLCDSVRLLFEKNPVLENLEGLFQIEHRISILQGFLENVDSEGFVKAEISGFTNTLRMTHRIVVNLPTVFVPWGKECRECLIAPDDDHLLCGSDISGLEDQTKRHYIWKYDPEYIKEMMTLGFDPHLDIAKQGGLISPEEEQYYKWYNFIKGDIEKGLSTYEFQPFETIKFKEIGKLRKDGKQGNFSCTYGAGPEKMVIASGMTLNTARIVHTAFWKRNWSLKAIEKEYFYKNQNNQIVLTNKIRVINNQMWLWNPVSQFWYSLRYTKDVFSTLNQSTASYVFDTWIRKIRNKSIKICGQFHDEKISPVLKTKTEERRQALLDAMDETNEELKLNVKIGISVAFGHSYADIH